MPGEGRGMFLNLFSQKMMDGISGEVLPAPVGDVSRKTGRCEGKGAQDQSLEASPDSARISALVSALAASLVEPAVSGPAEKDVQAIAGFLGNILDLLSGGDEIELKQTAGSTADITAAGAAPKEGSRQKDLENGAADSFAGSLAVFLAALNRMARQDTEEPGYRSVDSGIPGTGRMTDVVGPERPHAARAAKAVAPDPAVISAAQDETKGKAAEAPALLVEVTRSVKDNKIADISIKDVQKKPAFAVPVAPGEKKVEDLPDRPDGTGTGKAEGDRIIIRVLDKDDTDLRNDTGDRPANENSLGLQGNSHRNSGEHKPEVHAAAKSDFSTVMMDRIEKLTEHYAVKGPGMDMTVKLKIDDNETIVVGLRDDGASVTVEVRTANENTFNFIQSQKNDLMKNLEEKYIMTTIHVDIDQDAQGRRDQGKRRENGRDGLEETQDFNNVFEAVA